ncbi:MAG: glycosyltransferase family 39 protein [Anaerolineae bacterium]|nr:glycosyltransferase family 39 protein [Anaerolineae bacterium]
MLISLTTFAIFRTSNLDDFDSLNFANALESGFAPQRGLPHPPGYFSYVFSVRALAGLTGDVPSALTWFSALSGAATVGVLFDTARRLAGGRAGLFAMLLTWGTPVFFLSSLKALSDVPGMLGVSFAIWALSLRNVPLPWVAGLGAATGWLLGVRPQSFLGIIVAAGLVYGRRLPAQWARAAALALGGLAGVSLWVIPTAAAFSWDVGALVHYLLVAPRYIAAYESIPAALTPDVLGARWQALTTWVHTALGGSAPPALGTAFIVAGCATACFGLFASSASASSRCLLAVATLVQGGIYALLLDVPQTRYLLPVLAPFNLLVALGLARLTRRALWAGATATLLFAWALVATLPLAHTLQNIPPAPIQAAEYLKRRLSTEDAVVVVARQSHIFLRRELPTYTIIFLDSPAGEQLHAQLREQPPRWVVVVDPEGFRPDWPYREIERTHFQRDPRVHAKHAYVEVELYEYAPLWVPDLPEDGRLDIGAPGDGGYVGLGWYRREEIGGASGRWSGAEGESALVRMRLPRPVSRLSFRAWSFVPEQRVQVDCNGVAVGQFAVAGTWASYEAALPAGCREQGQQLELRFTVARLRAPRELGVTADPRKLGIAVDEIVVR